jgi:hypothetical protein
LFLGGVTGKAVSNYNCEIAFVTAAPAFRNGGWAVSVALKGFSTEDAIIGRGALIKVASARRIGSHWARSLVGWSSWSGHFLCVFVCVEKEK